MQPVGKAATLIRPRQLEDSISSIPIMCKFAKVFLVYVLLVAAVITVGTFGAWTITLLRR
jgi:hypothetical protein